MNLADALDDATTEGGGTYGIRILPSDEIEVTSVDRDYGFFVSRKGGIEGLPDLYFDVMREFVANRLLEGEHRGGLLGLWQDEDGLWSVDVAVWIEDFSEALDFARANNQRSIYNIGMNHANAV